MVIRLGWKTSIQKADCGSHDLLQLAFFVGVIRKRRSCTMNKTIVFTVGILSTALLIGYYFYQQTDRYYITVVGGGGAYEVDKKTGQTWVLYGDKKINMINLPNQNDITILPNPKDIEQLENKDTGTTTENNILKK